MLAKVKFCAIDAKDYAPVYFEDGDIIRDLGEQGENLMALMQREYLTRLRTLQQEIAAKYEPLFPYDEVPCDEDDQYEVQEAAAKAAEKAFPGEEADYRT